LKTAKQSAGWFGNASWHRQSRTASFPATGYFSPMPDARVCRCRAAPRAELNALAPGAHHAPMRSGKSCTAGPNSAADYIHDRIGCALSRNEHVARFNAANLTPAPGGVAAPHADPHW
jgi:hypothetical protein